MYWGKEVWNMTNKLGSANPNRNRLVKKYSMQNKKDFLDGLKPNDMKEIELDMSAMEFDTSIADISNSIS